MTKDQAWEKLKRSLGSIKWTVGEAFNYRGFFNWGWEGAKNARAESTPQPAGRVLLISERDRDDIVHLLHATNKSLIFNEEIELLEALRTTPIVPTAQGYLREQLGEAFRQGEKNDIAGFARLLASLNTIPPPLPHCRIAGID
jgi:hypothetical protein